MAQEWYSVEQVAERLGLHVRTIRSYVRAGRLNAVRIGKQYRISREDLEAFTGTSAAQACENLITERTEDALDALERSPIDDETSRKALADLAIAATARRV